MKNNRNFENWLKSFRESIADYEYYIDFKTVYNNVKKYEKEISLLNTIVGSKNIEADFIKLIQTHPNVLKVIPTMLAKREHVIPCTDRDGTINYRFDSMVQTADDYVKFMTKTGLFDLLKNQITANLSLLITGIEIGSNSNARKNRGGHLMENLVEDYIQKAGFIKGKTYFKEMYLSDLEKMTGLNLSSLSNAGKVAKRFDFVIIGKQNVYACECNFYASSGSKLNETARSYKTLAIESKNIKGFKFVWFTDGTGWNDAKNNLKETFDVLEHLYNIKDLESGILKELK